MASRKARDKRLVIGYTVFLLFRLDLILNLDGKKKKIGVYIANCLV